MKKHAISSVHPAPSGVQRCQNRGIALVLTLAILAIVTLLVIAFTVSMRVEMMASRNFNDLVKARELANAAVDQAVATIRNATPVITPTATYVTSPGVIYTWNGTSWTPNALFTTGNNWDLNAGNVITGTNTVYTFSPPISISVGWSNVVANGQLVGRYVYWVDDESAKVDINVAGTRGNDLEGQTPAAIDLQALFSAADQVDITNFIVVNSRPFDTLECIKLVTNNLTGNYIDQLKYYTNQFYMTVNSISPDVTTWGAKRLNLSNVVATASPQTAVTNIAAMLSDANLVTWFGKTFGNKYNPPNGAYQIAANIVDYIDSDNIPTDSTTVGPLDTLPPDYLGLEVTPYLSEIDNTNSLSHTQSPGSPRAITVNVSATVDLWNMYTNSWTIPANTEVFITNVPPIMLVNNNIVTGILTTNNISPSNITIPVGSGTFPAGLPNATATYQIYSTPATAYTVTFPDDDTNSFTTITYGSGTATAIFRTTVGALRCRIDYAQIPMGPKNGEGIVTIDANGTVSLPSAVSPGLARVSEVNDPRVKPVSTDWHTLTSVSGALGSQKSVFNTSVATPFQADGDTSCHIISGSRDRGTMYPGEMDFIHTGASWRTFRLQPQITGEAAPPDWAVLDLFSATTATNIVGRININGSVISAGNIVPTRLAPLNALLTNNLPAPSAYVNGTAVANIDTFVLGTTNSLPFNQNQYTMMGQICETIGLATNDLSSANRNKAKAETPVRGIANLITPRSNIFTIWVIAQGIKDVNKNGSYDPPPTGQDFITGEVRAQAVVERYENPPGTVHFRTKYFRYIYQ